MTSYKISLYESDTTTIYIDAECTLKQAVQEAENICKQTGVEY